MVEPILFGNKRKVLVDLYIDSQALIDSIRSSKQVDRKVLCPIITDMKDNLTDGDI